MKVRTSEERSSDAFDFIEVGMERIRFADGGYGWWLWLSCSDPKAPPELKAFTQILVRKIGLRTSEKSLKIMLVEPEPLTPWRDRLAARKEEPKNDQPPTP